MAVEMLRVDEIVISDRHRKEMGDIDELAESIKTNGLLHPIVVTPERKLVVGERRLLAFQQLGRDEIPANVVDTFADTIAMLVAERDENTCRKDMTRTEQATLGMQLEELEKPKAEARQAATQAKPGEGRVGGSPETPTGEKSEDTGKTARIVGDALGISEASYRRLKRTHQAALQDPDPVVREEAEKALQEMDETGNIAQPAARVQKVRKQRQQETEKPGRSGGKPGQKYANWDKESDRYRNMCASRVEKVWKALQRLDVMSVDLAEGEPELIRDGVTEDGIGQMTATVEAAVKNLNRFKGSLRQ